MTYAAASSCLHGHPARNYCGRSKPDEDPCLAAEWGFLNLATSPGSKPKLFGERPSTTVSTAPDVDPEVRPRISRNLASGPRPWP